jgi:16S rRNA (guanine527-N7)-methyltransferase
MASFTRTRFQETLGVSHETAERLETHLKLLETWAPRINLVGPRELAHYWNRHALDSAQLAGLAPGARRWVDLGTGAGFPGLVIACLLAETPGAQIDLVETNAKRVAFLREAIRATGAPARVYLQDAAAPLPGPHDIITARAFAPLPRIMEFAKPYLQGGAIGLFPKGVEVGAELAAAEAAGWRLTVEKLPSLTDPRACVLRISGAEHG